MGKIKFKLSNGIEDEKNVITAFKIGVDSYVILDSGTTGSMRLPIVLVSKLVGNKLTKILDQNEWQKAKEYLKMIISGSAMEYMVVPSTLNADEVYYTQLALPQASFDIMTNSYKPVSDNVVNTPISVESPFVPNIEVTPIAPAVQPTFAPESSTPVIPQAPVIAPIVTETRSEVLNSPINVPINPVIPETPAPVTPVVPVVPAPVASVVESAPIIAQPVVAPIEPVNVTPAVEPAVPVQNNAVNIPVSMPVNDENVVPVNSGVFTTEDKYKYMKETFLKSCENMFEALVKQMEDKK